MAFSPLSLRDTIQAGVEARIPAALTLKPNPLRRRLPSGILAIDHASGGIPAGALTQLCAPQDLSSGKTTLLYSLLAHSTQQGECCALVDAGDSFDPESAATSGVRFQNLLWARCSNTLNWNSAGWNSRDSRPGERAMQPLEQAFRCADILLQAGGFRVIVLDLGNIEARLVRKIPMTTWFRFSRVVEKQEAALLVLSQQPIGGSCASLVIELRPQAMDFSPALSLLQDSKCAPPHAQLLRELKIDFAITRARGLDPFAPTHDSIGRRKPARSVQNFSATNPVANPMFTDPKFANTTFDTTTTIRFA